MSGDSGMDAGGESGAAATPIDAALRLLEMARAEPPGVGERIGPFELLEEIGRGTHSAVYRARQQAPVAREVAVKILFDGDARGGIAGRFRRERALLARLQHPGVVPLLECGETEPTAARGPRPWFAMPFVAGEPIDRWCARHRADVGVRLLLIERAAEAVGAAHALGIVHRDLKPGNILVSGPIDRPEVHVIDFGIAKLRGDDGAGPTTAPDATATRVGAVVGTPEFMSPEQGDLDAARVGPSSDVYALGLVACLLLAGRVPGAAGAEAAEHAPAEQPPMGVRLRAAATRAVPVPSRLAGDRRLRGETDWIVAKACATDPRERYATADALAEDLARKRLGQPIAAAPRDSGYTVAFVLRRHRVAIALGAIAVASVVALLSVLAIHERTRAEEEAGRRARLTELLEETRKSLVPLTGRARGDIVADRSQAVAIASSMHAVNVELLGADAVESQRSALTLARALDRASRHAESEAIFRGLLAQAERAPDRQGDAALINTQLVGALRRQGSSRASEGLALADAALARHEALGDTMPSAIEIRIERGMLLDFLKRHEEARASLEQGLALALSRNGPSHFLTRQVRGFLADHDRVQGRADDARAAYLESLQGWPIPTPPFARQLEFEELLALGWRGEVLAIDCLRGTASEADRAELAALANGLEQQIPGDPRPARWREASGAPSEPSGQAEIR
ncbi:MAG: serine/threonine-protein kinase [Planctomycetaceae bacterium]|nr:serine/threonine-protein kinase [Planctomycetaceae bacterium]